MCPRRKNCGQPAMVRSLPSRHGMSKAGGARAGHIVYVSEKQL